PARLGQGVTALFGCGATAAHCARAEALLAAAGATVWLEAEAQFDAVTGLSGSGPAYVFAFIEALAAAGVANGLSAPLAARLARATVTGAAALAAEPGADPAALRVAVTSPGGTTAAGLAVLVDRLAPLLVDTVAAATARSRQLG
ncbi:MAG: pyrroline-5-carboxylate reductase dimerization domain-containing protein, partial [Polymorphobacter sp.]